MTTLETELCTICHKPAIEHEERGFKHRFSPPGQPSALFARTDQAQSSSSQRTSGAQGAIRIPTAGDPVLRMALIRKGVLTVADLDEVEAELRATGVAGYDPQSLGEPGSR